MMNEPFSTPPSRSTSSDSSDSAQAARDAAQRDWLEVECLRSDGAFAVTGRPAVPPIVPAAVWECESTGHADALLSQATTGYVYQRDAHPNGDWLAQHVRHLHRADGAAITSSGMAALSTALLAHCQAGDHLLVSDQLYGRTLLLMGQEAKRLGMIPLVVDLNDDAARKNAWEQRPGLAVVETITNPRLRVADLPQLAHEAHEVGALLLVDNTFATPLVCQPLLWGADLVMESVSKLMNGHGDLMLGALAGRGPGWERIEKTISTWGFACGPWEAWLAQRGLGTLGLRVERACRTALQLAQASVSHPAIASVDYPGLATHPDHHRAAALFAQPQEETRFGHVMTVHFKAGRAAVDRWISENPQFPFCPSLGELRTTVSHPASTSHRSLPPESLAKLGIDGGTLRVSVGVEPTTWVLEHWIQGLNKLG